MAYEIKFTDFVNKGSLTVETNSVNAETSLQLPGRNLTDYGRLVGENFLHLLENFANNNPPSNPVEGQLWYDTTVNVDQLKIYDGTQWVSANGFKKASATPDNRSSSVGDLWVNTTTQQLYLFNGSRWILIGPEFNSGTNSGSRFVTVDDINDNSQSVIINYINNTPILIISTEEFIPKVSISGFSLIRKGITLAAGHKFYGISERAESLVIPGEANPVPANKFARLDKENRFNEAMRIAKNDGLRIGETATFAVAISSGNSVISNLIQNGNITFRVNNGTLRNSLTIKPSTEDTLSGVGINNINPLAALDVVGSALISQNLTVNNNLIVTNSTTIGGTLAVADQLSVTGNIVTDGNLSVKNILTTSASSTIGTSSNPFENIYSSTFTGDLNGTALTAGTANLLTSPQPFSFTGDLEIPAGESLPEFDGGSPVTFNVRVKSSFVNDRTTVTTVNPLDEILISRQGSLVKIEQQNLVKNIPVEGVIGPVVPVGTVLPYVGDSAPPGWLICDGGPSDGLLNTGTFRRLWEVIGYKYGQVGSNFRIPDLRGRFLLGALLGATSNLNTRVTTNSDIIGRFGGSERRSLSENNLPEHEHQLKDNLGSQYYAVSPSTLPGDNTVELPFSGNNAGSGIPLRGLTGVYPSETPETPEAFDIVNPYATINYIIYYGA
jgi:microcystin-dependent protein